MKKFRITGLAFIFTLLLGALPVLGAEEFVPLVPSSPFDTSGTLTQFLNSVFQFSIVIGSIGAVIMIVVGGFEYMTSESLQNKANGRDQIQSAVGGLLLLLMAWLMLYVVNPDILSLNLKDFGLKIPPQESSFVCEEGGRVGNKTITACDTERGCATINERSTDGSGRPVIYSKTICGGNILDRID